MASFYQKSGWVALKREYALADKPNLDTCCAKMDASLKKFHAVNYEEISLKNLEGVYDAVELFQGCVKKQKADASVLRMTQDMHGDAKKFRDDFDKTIKKGAVGFFQKSGWAALKREHDFSAKPELQVCLLPVDKALRDFHALGNDEITAKSVDAVHDAIETFHGCTKKNKADSSILNFGSEMRSDAKKFSDAIMAITKKGMS